jgi:Zn-dependent protease with chaperone function
MTTPQTLARRALIAVLLTIGFYLLAFAIAAVLIYIPYAEWTYAGRIHIKILLSCLIGAGIILWSIIPRIDRFKPPGPRLEPQDHPKLFSVLADVAAKTGQEMPAEVYAIGELNAWVTDRGGILGIGGRRVMGLGLPLLRVLNISQARGVIAHEFGHFYGGDTKLGPWIFKTRNAIFRTLQGLEAHGSLLQKPFTWYGNAFMKITQSISRNEEFVADRLAAGIVGSRAMIEGLTAIHGTAIVFDSFWHNEYAPAIDRGCRPPLTEGFARFLAVPGVDDAVKRIIGRELEEGETDIYDSHPSLRDRIAALEQLTTAEDQDTTPAISLLNDVDELEDSFITGLLDREAATKLSPIGWEEAGRKVWLPIWEETAKTYSRTLAEVRLRDLPEHLDVPVIFAERVMEDDCEGLSDQDRTDRLVGVIGSAIAVTLAGMGWRLDAAPGSDVVLTGNGATIAPFAATRQLITREMAGDAWIQTCTDASIADVALGSA